MEIATALTSARSKLFYTHPRVSTLQLWFTLTYIMGRVGVSHSYMRVASILSWLLYTRLQILPRLSPLS